MLKYSVFPSPSTLLSTRYFPNPKHILFFLARAPHISQMCDVKTSSATPKHLKVAIHQNIQKTEEKQQKIISQICYLNISQIRDLNTSIRSKIYDNSFFIFNRFFFNCRISFLTVSQVNSRSIPKYS